MSVEFGLFGGSFNPPHVAHALLAAYALSAHRLERILIVPTFAHPFGKPLAPFEDRLRMCELAFADLKRVEVSAIERTLPTPSLTLHTVEALARLHRGVQLRFLIGADLLPETPTWHNFARIAELAPPLVFGRQGYPTPAPDRPLLPEISSSEVRRRLRSGESCEGLLAPDVENYARAQRLFE